MEICVTNNNKLKINSKRMATFKKVSNIPKDDIVSKWDPDMCKPIVGLVVTEEKVYCRDVLNSFHTLLKVALHML